MTRTLSALILASTISAFATSAALAHDSDDDDRPSYSHLRKDEAQVDADLRKVREEERHVANARHELRETPWWFGNSWGTRQAANKVREEQSELSSARAKLYRDQLDVYRDRSKRYETD